MSCIRTINFAEFYDGNKKRFGEFAFLFGNGLIQSYPKGSPKHEDVLGSVAFEKSELELVWKNINEYFQAVFKIIPNEITPENLLNVLRRVYSFYVFEQFIDKQRKLKANEIHTPRKFFKLFKSIYTLNYDYITYVSIFKDSLDIVDRNSIKDGFSGSDPISLNDIESKLKTEIPFRFLHGAFHIFQQEDKQYYKIVSDNGNFLDKVKNKYNAIRSHIPHLLDPESKTEHNPIIVFSGKSRNKLAMIKDNTYLDSCLKKLGCENKIFTFGCSFERDSHILDTIFRDKDNKSKNVEAYIGYIDQIHKRYVIDYVQNNSIDGNDITFVDLSDTDAIAKRVWSQQSLVERLLES